MRHDVLIALGGILAILVIASVVTFALRTKLSAGIHRELNQRLQSWWTMVAIFAVAISVSDIVSLIFFALVSFLALKEYLSLIPTRRVDRQVIFWAYLAIPLQYVLVGYEWYGMFIILIPVYAFLLLPMRMVLAGETANFLRAMGTLHWGLMAMVFSISHVAYLLVLPEEVNPGAGGAGLVLFLVFLTQFNDVSQYIWGKLFGRHQAVPTVSPAKSVEGLIGGLVTTTALALVLGPWLTPLDQPQSIGAGLIIGTAGFVGDAVISALKRDLGVKDSGSLLPGHGGVLDRVDSLIYTAPLFFHYTFYLHY
ncbi:phosphatidate cytidylyltransferase [Halostreptopolyspora alba]|uniref:Phosphatidate cytidylyltransferase n=1 Tax=Halostreptopolyspora alba TaxID=2487137 RepID=A0A3N0EBX0_9ACTN|nr:phosphatidate cytidylyltransferase [Nocardiopsaceae bacterium YIM 96095]